MNKINSLIYILFFLFGFSCSSQEKTKYLIKSIDTVSLSKYYILKVSNASSLFTVLSEKMDFDKGKLLKKGDYIKLELDTITGFKVSNYFIRIGRGFFVDGIKLFDTGEKLYQSDCLRGLNNVCD